MCITGRDYAVYEGRKAIAHLVDHENSGITAEEVEAARVADYPKTLPKEA